MCDFLILKMYLAMNQEFYFILTYITVSFVFHSSDNLMLKGEG